MALFDELKRRNVIRVALAYLAGAWLLIQVLETLFPIFDLQETAIRIVVIILAIGFLPALAVSWVFELTPEGLKKDKDAVVGRTDTRKIDRLIIVFLVLGIGYFAVDKFIIDPKTDQQEIDLAVERAKKEALIASYGDKKIVVLPFENLTGDPTEDYFSHGMAEELLEFLQRIPELLVVSRTTGQLLKEGNLSVTEIAAKVDATHVLEGSFRKSGDTYRITAQLIAADADAHLFSETYDRRPADILELQTEIAARVADAMAVELVYQEQPADVNPEAYENYQRGRYLLDQAKDTDESIGESLALLKRAVELEPDWVPGISQLARAHWRRGNISSAEQRKANLEEIRRLVARLNELDPSGTHANSWNTLLAYRIDGDYFAAARHAEAALTADPYNLPMLRVTANLLGHLGREEEAIVVGRYVLAHDPACNICINNIAYVLRQMGRYQDAAELLETSLEWYPQENGIYWQIGAAWLGAGEAERALEAFEMLEDESSRRFARLFALHTLGRSEEFEREFEILRNSPERSLEGVTRVYAWSGDMDAAFAGMEQMIVEMGPETTAMLLESQFYVRMRKDPRWDQFLNEYGIRKQSAPRAPFDPVLPAVIEAELYLQRQASGDSMRP